MDQSHELELSKEEMKSYGYRVIDTIVEHFVTQNEKSPVAMASRKEMDAIFQEPIPEFPSDPKEVLDFVTKNVLPNSNIVSHPKSYSFVPGPSNYVSVMADTLATGFNIFSGGWAASPAAAELEIVSMNWLLKLFKFPSKKGGGIFTSGGSMANLTALVTARRQLCGDDFSKAIIYMSDQAHSSNVKAIRVIGFKKEQIRIIPTDGEFKMVINKLKNAISRDRLTDLQPFCIIANAGTTNTGTVDPLEQIAEICKNEKLWFHIDGAYGGAAMLSKKGSKALKGIEKADSLTIDPHKWLFQPYEMGCLLVRKSKWLRDTFVEKPEYLRDIEGNPSEINFYDHGIQLTRRFRALKFYMSMKTFGLEAFRKAVSYNIEIAEEVEDLLRKSKQWEVVSSATLAIINFRYHPLHLDLSDEQLDTLNQEISKRVVESEESLLVTTVLNKQVVLRMCLINPRTTMVHIKETISSCENFAKQILEE
jgi:aromatic-L-amino-acid decarboxylase